jgi:hypothetical protein
MFTIHNWKQRKAEREGKEERNYTRENERERRYQAPHHEDV